MDQAQKREYLNKVEGVLKEKIYTRSGHIKPMFLDGQLGFITAGERGACGNKNVFKITVNNPGDETAITYSMIRAFSPNAKPSIVTDKYLRDKFIRIGCMLYLARACTIAEPDSKLRNELIKHCFSGDVYTELMKFEAARKTTSRDNVLEHEAHVARCTFPDEGTVTGRISGAKPNESNTQARQEGRTKTFSKLYGSDGGDWRGHLIMEAARQRESNHVEDALSYALMQEQDRQQLYKEANKFEKENKMNDMIDTAKDLNIDAAKIAAKITAGKALNTVAQEKLVPFLPENMQAYAGTPLGNLVVANIVAAALTHFAPSNNKAYKAGDAMITAAMVDTASIIQIEELVKGFLNADIMAVLGDD